MTVEHLMLVDDDEDDRTFFLEVMETIKPALVCRTARNGRDALSQLTAGALPELIFLDLNMPLMNGWEFLSAIKQIDRLKHIPVAVLTTSSDFDTKEQTKRLGASFFITKPDRISNWEKVFRDFFDHYQRNNQDGF